MPRTFNIIEQDTGIDIRKLRNFFNTKDKIQEGKEIFQPVYTDVLNWAYERHERANDGYEREKARFVRDYVFKE